MFARMMGGLMVGGVAGMLAAVAIVSRVDVGVPVAMLIGQACGTLGAVGGQFIGIACSLRFNTRD